MLYLDLRIDGELPSVEAHTHCYDAELDTLDSILFDACAELGETGQAEFTVVVCDHRPGATVEVELDSFLEQLPDLMLWLRSEDPEAFSLEFPEQGAQYTIGLSRMADGAIRVTYTRWARPPGLTGLHCLTSAPDLEAMSLRVFRVFVDAVEQICPYIYGHGWFRQWMRSVQEAGRDHCRR